MFCMLKTLKEELPFKVFIIGFKSRRLLLFDNKYKDVGRVPFKHRLDYFKMTHNFSEVSEGVNEFFIRLEHTFIMWCIIKSSDNKYRVVK